MDILLNMVTDTVSYRRMSFEFGAATGALSVTKEGTAPSMPAKSEIEALLKRGRSR